MRELIEHPNKVFKNGKDVEGGRCMRGSDARKISRESLARAHVKNYERGESDVGSEHASRLGGRASLEG